MKLKKGLFAILVFIFGLVNVYAEPATELIEPDEPVMALEGEEEEEEETSCNSNQYKCNSSCCSCTAGYGCNGSTRYACTGNTASGYGSGSCSSCASNKYANSAHTKCCDVTISSVSGTPKKASVGKTVTMTVNLSSECTLDSGNEIAVTASASYGTTSVSVSGMTATVKYTVTTACKTDTIKISAGGHTKSISGVQTRPNWSTIDRYYATAQPTSTAAAADAAGLDWYISSCSKINSGGYKCVYHYRGCGGISISHPPGCYYNPSTETLMWLKPEKVKQGFVYLQGVTQDKCKNKCKSSDNNTGSGVVDDGLHNTCSANKDFGPATFATKCTNDNSIIIHHNHPSLYTITCSEKLNYDIKYYGVAGNLLVNNSSTIKLESGMKVNTLVKSTITCSGEFDEDAYKSDQEVISQGAYLTDLDNPSFWENILDSYRKMAAVYNVWIKNKDYPTKVNNGESKPTYISYNGDQNMHLVNSSQVSGSYTDEIDVKCTSVKCMKAFNPNFKSFSNVEFKYEYAMKVPAAILENYLVGNEFLITKGYTGGLKKYGLQVKAHNMGYFHNWNYETKCTINIAEEAKYRIVDPADPFNQTTNPSRGIGQNWLNSQFDFTCMVKDSC